MNTLRSEWLKVLFTALFVLLFSFMISGTVNASSNNIYMRTDETLVPEEAKQFAEENYIKYLQALNIFEENDKNVYLGKPFFAYNFENQVDEIFLFPLFSENGELISILRVYDENDKYTGVLGTDLASYIIEENNLSPSTKENPYTLYVDCSGYYLEQSNGVKKVLDFGNKEDNSSIVEEKGSKHDLKSISDVVLLNEFSVSGEKQARATIIYSDSLANFTVRETQGSEGWCGAYVTAALLNATKNTSRYSAYQIMKELYPNLSGDAFYQQGLSDSEIAAYGRSQGRNASTASALNYNSAVDYIAKNSGILTHWTPREKSSPDGVGDHGMALVGVVGYSDGSTYFLIWNPWYTGVEIIDASARKYNLAPSVDYYYYYISSVVGL